MRWAGHVALMQVRRSAYRILIGETKGKIPVGRPRRIWGDNIKIDRKEIRRDSIVPHYFTTGVSGGLL